MHTDLVPKNSYMRLYPLIVWQWIYVITNLNDCCFPSTNYLMKGCQICLTQPFKYIVKHCCYIYIYITAIISWHAHTWTHHCTLSCYHNVNLVGRGPPYSVYWQLGITRIPIFVPLRCKILAVPKWPIRLLRSAEGCNYPVGLQLQVALLTWQVCCWAARSMVINCLVEGKDVSTFASLDYPGQPQLALVCLSNMKDQV